MKKSEIAVVVLITGISFFTFWFIINNENVLGDPFDRAEPVSFMRPISSELEDPDPEIFNRNAINPTVDVWIGVEDEWPSVSQDDDEYEYNDDQEVEDEE